MTFKRITKFFIMAFCAVCVAQPAFAKTVTLKTAWVVGQEGFVVWYAKKQGWDKAVGIDIDMQIYQAGKDALKDFTSDIWFIGGLGAIPTVIGAAEGNMSVIGIANNEARANAIMVKPNSPILAQKGVNSDYPAVYGSAASVKGKIMLASKATSSHYTLHMWLKALNLTEKDVEMKNIAQDIALLSFEHDKGDAVALWAPFTFVGDENGWKTVATARDVHAELPIFLVANTAFTKQYPDVTKNFLAIYMRGIQWMLDAPREEVAKELQIYFKEVLHQDYSDDMIDLHLGVFELFNLADQKKILAVSDGQSTARKWQNDITTFFVREGLFSKADIEKVTGSKYITSKYIDMVTSKEIK